MWENWFFSSHHKVPGQLRYFGDIVNMYDNDDDFVGRHLTSQSSVCAGCN